MLGSHRDLSPWGSPEGDWKFPLCHAVGLGARRFWKISHIWVLGSVTVTDPSGLKPWSCHDVPQCSPLLPPSGAILDITLIANVQSLSHSDFFLSCIMGERDVSYLQIERENKIVMTHPKTGFQNYRNRSNHVQARGFSMPDLVGILYCMGRTPTEQAQVVYVHNSHNGERMGR